MHTQRSILYRFFFCSSIFSAVILLLPRQFCVCRVRSIHLFRTQTQMLRIKIHSTPNIYIPNYICIVFCMFDICWARFCIRCPSPWIHLNWQTKKRKDFLSFSYFIDGKLHFFSLHFIALSLWAYKWILAESKLMKNQLTQRINAMFS